MAVHVGFVVEKLTVRYRLSSEYFGFSLSVPFYDGPYSFTHPTPPPPPSPKLFLTLILLTWRIW
jgi:hypothetical protein